MYQIILALLVFLVSSFSLHAQMTGTSQESYISLITTPRGMNQISSLIQARLTDTTQRQMIATEGCRLHALDAKGRELTGFPVNLATWFGNACWSSTPLATDFNGDGRDEIVVQNRWSLVILNADGSRFSSFNFNRLMSPEGVGIVTVQNQKLILAQGVSAVSNTVAFELRVPASGALIRAISTPANLYTNGFAIGDLDADGNDDLVYSQPVLGQSHRMYAVRLVDGAMIAGWPTNLGNVESSTSARIEPTLVDIDDDGRLEVAALIYQEWNQQGLVHLFNANGQYVTGWPQVLQSVPFVDNRPKGLTVADIDADNRPELIIPVGTGLHVYRGNGSLYPNFPINSVINPGHGTPVEIVTADLNGDRRSDMVLKYSGGQIFFIDHLGRIFQSFDFAASFPGVTFGNSDYSVPLIFDAAGDGDLNLAVAFSINEDTIAIVNSELHQPYKLQKFDWPMENQNPARTRRAGN